ncbi:hypothetical protein IFM89_039017 [Coptis chinensis]|uniref:Uncharacterized protein n=1 Tax=Coptis chinensis TaxID=261450 RepID=A0A835IH47_9MAGN|nr:hypothetical protein IFM89_039017 [Coptis chinensis]
MLDLSSNSFRGPIPNASRNMTSLLVLDLSYNRLNSSSPILEELTNLNNLKILNLTGNQFEPKAIEHFGNFSSPSVVDNLETLYLSHNQMDAYLPNWFYQLKNLKTLITRSTHSKVQFLQLLGLLLEGIRPHFQSSEWIHSTSLRELSALEFLCVSDNKSVV